MLYYYAHTGHKIGLDRLRRAAAVIKKLAEEGVECRLLLNDFRAGLAARDLGIGEYVTIETIQDIDAVAVTGDSVIIDSNEDDHGRLVKYCSDFKHVWRFAHDAEDRSIHGETLFRVDCKDDECLSAVIVNDTYFEKEDKEDRILFFLQDMDHDKTILNNASFFQSFEMELLLGNYFFVKYEDDLAKIFNSLYEPEEYTDLIKSSSSVVTASAQTALEAKAAGADVIYIDLGKEALYPDHLLEKYGVGVVSGFDTVKTKEMLERMPLPGESKIPKINISKITQVYQ
ncbi:hypothetical protein YH65_10020 [Sulfurovum lithotrophicum]|uniref:Uncharacterized protein n=1 Tax=Sulfurovum lithotrophicum TaxID=206403 RepID=A0A7U4RRC5_9BACT|nr:hypothetical protein [Sulfurovum lithotrophicum]AKF25680.1 hypothetical protein YH65_10020 [Sulfurovum lithotrophicum]